jgi:AbrB family looped-hinge helix DNA binding protein
MLEEEMKVGPKGQVVIPRTLRKLLKIYPGSKVIFKLKEGKLVLEKQFLTPWAHWKISQKRDLQ